MMSNKETSNKESKTAKATATDEALTTEIDAQPIIGLLYDFDKTLATKDMQEYTFLPQLGLMPKEFWAEANALSHGEKMDSVLAYMYLMIKKMRASSAEFRFTRDDIRALGHAVEFFPGVETWFKRLSNYGAKLGVKVEHYIISAGLREIIEGSKIAENFKEIFASEFHYDRYGAPDWPLMTVNYTGKTQYLFRINKGVLDVSDDQSLNAYTPAEARRIPFSNMAFFGDGMTDVPVMKLVKEYGGVSVAIYTKESYKKVKKLLAQNRVNYLMEADYSEGSALEQLAKDFIKKMAIDSHLRALEREQAALV